MAKLTSKKRAKLHKKDFALPEKRAYPIEDEEHARAALSRAAQFATPEEVAKIKKAVKKKFPKMKVA